TRTAPGCPTAVGSCGCGTTESSFGPPHRGSGTPAVLCDPGQRAGELAGHALHSGLVVPIGLVEPVELKPPAVDRADHLEQGRASRCGHPPPPRPRPARPGRCW